MNLFITSNPSCAPNDALKIKLNKAFIFLCEEENITNCSINLKIMDDMEMQKLNKDFRSINKPTNVLSFANEDISKEKGLSRVAAALCSVRGVCSIGNCSSGVSGTPCRLRFSSGDD